MKKILTYISYAALLVGAVIGVYALAGIYLVKSKLPPGVCPVNNNRPLLYTALALCGVSLVLSFFEPKAKEKAD